MEPLAGKFCKLRALKKELHDKYKNAETAKFIVQKSGIRNREKEVMPPMRLPRMGLP